MKEDNNMQQNTIIFRMGEETGIVIEEKNFKQSLFGDHYVKAIRLIDSFLQDDNIALNKSSNIITFSADRGEGKTSCMKTVAHIISNEKALKELKTDFAQLSAIKHIKPNDLKVLDTIDPAFFDARHNILEMTIGMMYKSLDEAEKDNNIRKTSVEKTDLISRFRNVQKALEYVEYNNANDEVYDPLEKILSLSAGLDLPLMIHDLFEEYLRYIGKKKLIICLDDIDLNIKYAYVMTEQIRKYLNNDLCIILLATNVEQLTMVVQESMDKQFHGEHRDTAENTNREVSRQMAVKYITKLLPTSQRINLVHLADLYNHSLVLVNDNEVLREWSTVKEAITQLIYAKTRYLFYNNESETSPIVPVDLRSFRHLMRFLWEMPEFQNVHTRDDIYTLTDYDRAEYIKGLANKSAFKNYFYQEWTKNLSENDARWVRELVDYSDVSGINKFVIQYLSNRMQSYGAEEKNNENKRIISLIYAITNRLNRSYNVSVGDVFYYISFLDSYVDNNDDKNLLFFIKSFYSMRLYEYYNVITEQQEQLYPHRVQQVVNIYPIDARFEHVNMLQKLVNGSYFTYSSSDYMAVDNDIKMARDLHLINAPLLRDLFNDVVSYFLEHRDSEDKDWILKLKICEFFAWTVSRRAYSDEKIDVLMERTQIQPQYFGEYPNSTNYFVFDVLAPFYTATNIEYAYKRLVPEFEIEKPLVDNFYTIAKGNSLSLLHEAISATIEGQEYDIEEDFDRVMNRLLSGSIIRNADVLVSLSERIIGRRALNSKNKGDMIVRLSSFYSDLEKTDMSTYQTRDDDRYQIQFKFFKAFVEFLNALNEKGNEQHRELFMQILTDLEVRKQKKN